MENEEKSSGPKENRKSWSKLKTRKLMKTGVLIIGVLLFLALFTNKLDFLKPTGWTTANQEAVELQFYVMSQCPYGTQVEDAIKPVLDEFGDSVDFHLDYIAQANEDGTFTSLHDQPEVDENIRQLCAMELSPEAYMDYIVCQNKDIVNAESTWESCAEEAGIDVSAMKGCAEGSQGKQLLSESITKAMEAQAMGSPTIFIEGETYSGNRDTLSFKRAICQHLENPEACAEIPECSTDADCNAEPGKVGVCVEDNCEYKEDAAFDVIVLNDKECGEACDSTAILTTTKQYFMGANFKELDVSDPEAQELIENLGLEKVPAYLFEPNVEETHMWQNTQISSSFEKKGQFWKLMDQATGATHWIDKEAREAYEAEQAAKFEKYGINLNDGKPSVNLMIMSQCPYGISAFDAMRPVIDLFGNKIDFHLDYIAKLMQDGTFNSLHGQPEVEENIRQLCAMDIAPEKAMEYISCQNAKYNEFIDCEYNRQEPDCVNEMANWQSCAEEAGIDVEELRECSEGEQGAELFSESIEVSNVFKATGSPTLMLEGEAYQGARTPAAFQAAICSLFEEQPEECSVELEGVDAVAPSEGAC